MWGLFLPFPRLWNMDDVIFLTTPFPSSYGKVGTCTSCVLGAPSPQGGPSRATRKEGIRESSCFLQAPDMWAIKGLPICPLLFATAISPSVFTSSRSADLHYLPPVCFLHLENIAPSSHSFLIPRYTGALLRGLEEYTVYQPGEDGGRRC